MYKKIKIGSCINNLGLVEKLVDEVTNEIGVSQDFYGKILVSTMEGVNNAIIHGNKSIPEKMVNVEMIYLSNDLKIKISDEGEGFRPDSIPDPTMPENRESLNGRGVYLMSHLADKISFSKKGNQVTMTFKNIVI